MFDLFLPKYVKDGKRLLEAVNKFIAYNKDLMKPERLARIEEAKTNFRAVLETRNPENLKLEEETLKKVCDDSLPNYKVDAIKENIEVLLVAVIVALGVRAYLVQPFKIPTASMQPTLNGLIGEPVAPDAAKPNFLQQAFNFVWRGSNFTELKAPQSSGNLAITRITQHSILMFCTRTTVQFSDGSSQTCYAPATQLFRDLWLENEQPSTKSTESRGPWNGPNPLRVEDFTTETQIPVKPGAVLARGTISTGDQLLVDKFSYNFRQPRRGEVFVFNTMGIATDGQRPAPSPTNNIPSQHYIKRLVGTPNDKLAVIPPALYINGETAKEPGILRVMAHEGNPNRDSNINMLHGYTHTQGERTLAASQVATETVNLQGQPVLQYNLNEHQFFAMGDNSGHSSDSRYWGAVPQQNVVGPALVVYWPFAPHWGRIK